MSLRSVASPLLWVAGVGVIFAGCGAGEPTDGGDSGGSGGSAADSGGDSAADSGGDSGDSAADSGGDSGADSGVGELRGAAAVVANPDDRFSAIVEVQLDHDGDVVVRYGEGALDHATPPRAVTAFVTARIPLFGLRAGKSWEVQATATAGAAAWEDTPKAFATDALPAGWPVCTANFTAPESDYSRDEVVCSNSRYGSSHVYSCWDRWGEPVLAIRDAFDDSLFSMTPLPGGGWASTGYNNAAMMLFDELGAIEHRYGISWFTGTRFEHDWVDVHELTPIVEGEWAGAVVFVTDSFEYFSDGSYKLGNGFIVYDPAADEVLYDFSFHGELGDQEPFSPLMPYERTGWGDYPQDWNHLNSIVHGLDGDGRQYFLLSLKAQNWIFKLYPDTDELAWRLGADGEFTLVDDLDAADPEPLDVIEWQSHQHGVWEVSHTGDRTSLLMFDNGYPRIDASGARYDLQYSRVVELTLDEGTGRAALAFDWGSRAYGAADWFFSTSRGNAELLPGGDRVVFLSGEQMLMREVAYPDGGERWEMRCPTDDEGMYRVHWFPDLYHRDWAWQ